MLKPTRSALNRQPAQFVGLSPRWWASVLVPSASGVVDLVQPSRVLTISASTSVAAGQKGIEYVNSSSNAGVSYSGGWGSVVPTSDAITFYALCYVNATGSRQVLFSDWTSGGSGESAFVEITSTNFWRIGANGGSSTSSTAVTVGWHTVVMSMTSGGSMSLWVDGVSSISGFAGGARTSGNTAKWLGSGAFVGSIGWQGRAALLAIERGRASGADAKAFADNPWGIFQGPVGRPWINSVAGGGGAVLASSAQAVASLSATLTTGIPLASAAAAAAAVSAVLTTGIPLSASAAAQATLTAALTVSGVLTASLSAQATLTGDLTTSIRLSASAQAVATMSAALTGGTALAAKRNTRRQRYTPSTPPADVEGLRRWLMQEFERLTDALESPATHVLLESMASEPGRIVTGKADIRYADGTSWNPGSGEGVYAYYAGSWKKLG